MDSFYKLKCICFKLSSLFIKWYHHNCFQSGCNCVIFFKSQNCLINQYPKSSQKFFYISILYTLIIANNSITNIMMYNSLILFFSSLTPFSSQQSSREGDSHGYVSWDHLSVVVNTCTRSSEWRVARLSYHLLGQSTWWRYRTDAGVPVHSKGCGWGLEMLLETINIIIRFCLHWTSSRNQASQLVYLEWYRVWVRSRVMPGQKILIQIIINSNKKIQKKCDRMLLIICWTLVLSVH